MSEAVTEMIFVKQVLESIGEKVQVPMKLYMDNCGAIFLANNKSSTGRTKHIDVRHHFIRDLIQDNILVIEFVRTEDNLADILTKNLMGPKFEQHANNLIGEDLEMSSMN